MVVLTSLWESFAVVFDALLWFFGSYLGLRMVFVLARRRRVVGVLTVVSHSLPLVTALLLLLWRFNWLDRWVLLRHGLETLLVVLAVFVLLHIGDRWLTRRLEAQGRPNLVPRLMREIGRVVILVITVFIAISRFFQAPIGTILLSSTVFTAIVGFALQDLLKNVFAGIALQIERPFVPGDWIYIDKTHNFGRVLEMSWRAIRVRPRDGQVVIIPNSVIAQQQITNLSATGRPIAMRLTVTVDNQHPPALISELLKEAVLAVDGVLSDPRPFVYSREFTAATALYEIKFWVANYEHYPEQQGTAMSRIWYVFQRAGVPFAPHEVVVHSTTVDQYQRHATYTPEQIVQRLRKVAILDVLDEGELYELAPQIKVQLFTVGEVLAHQGCYETKLYAITRGLVQVEVLQDGAQPLVLTTLGPGEVFGERGLLMGEPRSANVVALEDTRTLVIDRADLLPFFERHPELPERLASILAQRLSATNATLEQQRTLALGHKRTLSADNPTLAERIRRVLFDLGA